MIKGYFIQTKGKNIYTRNVNKMLKLAKNNQCSVWIVDHAIFNDGLRAMQKFFGNERGLEKHFFTYRKCNSGYIERY